MPATYFKNCRYSESVCCKTFMHIVSNGLDSARGVRNKMLTFATAIGSHHNVIKMGMGCKSPTVPLL